MIPRLLGARVILDLHDLMPEFLASRLGVGLGDWRVRIVTLQERIACALADHAITVTEPWRQTLVARARVRASRTSVVLNVADNRHFVPAEAPPAVDDDASFRLIYHGTLAYRYGIDLLVEAVARLSSIVPGIHLTIHGQGELSSRLELLVEELGVGDRVRFSRDFLPVEALPALIRSAHVGVVPYRADVFTSGILPTKLMEYAAVGVPAVVSRTPAVEAYFDEGMVAYFDPGDVDGLVSVLQALHEDRDRLRTLREGIARFPAAHSWTLEARRYVQLVNRLARRTAQR